MNADLNLSLLSATPGTRRAQSQAGLAMLHAPASKTPVKADQFALLLQAAEAQSAASADDEAALPLAAHRADKNFERKDGSSARSEPETLGFPLSSTVEPNLIPETPSSGVATSACFEATRIAVLADETDKAPHTGTSVALPLTARLADKNFEQTFEHPTAPSLTAVAPWPAARPDTQPQALPSAAKPDEALGLPTQTLAHQGADTAPVPLPELGSHAAFAAAKVQNSAELLPAAVLSSSSHAALGAAASAASSQGDSGTATPAGHVGPSGERAQSAPAGQAKPAAAWQPASAKPAGIASATPSAPAALASVQAQLQAHAAWQRSEAVRAPATPAPLLAAGWAGAALHPAPVAGNAAGSVEPAALDLGEFSAAAPSERPGPGAGGSGAGTGTGGNGGQPPGAYGAAAGLELGSAAAGSGETTAPGSEFAQQLDTALTHDGWASVFEPLGQQISLWAAGQTQKAQLLLHDGLRQTLQVELRLEDAQAHLDFYTDDAALRETLLEQAHAALSELLERSGLGLAGLSVGARSSGDRQAPEQNRRDAAAQARSADSAHTAPSGARELAQHLRSGAGRAGLSVYV